MFLEILLFTSPDRIGSDFSLAVDNESFEFVMKKAGHDSPNNLKNANSQGDRTDD